MTVPFQVADAIASLLASSPGVAAAAGVSPRVYLHGIDPGDESDPVIFVSAGAETRPIRGDRAFEITVAIGCRPADRLGGNPAAAIARPDGVLVLGADSSRIDAIAEAVAEAVEDAEVGAILAGSEIETDTLDPAAHSALVTFRFERISTF